MTARSLEEANLPPGYPEALAHLKADLAARLGNRLRGLLLFGSRARGEGDPGSDVDVAILVEGLSPADRREILDLVVGIELERLTPLSTLILSTQDLDGLRRRERRLARDLDEEGIAL